MSSKECIYIVFTEAERPKWFMRFLKHGFSHCYAIQPHKGQWLKYEYGHGRLRVDLLPNFEYDANHCIIVKTFKEDVGGCFAIKSCVGFIKMLIGIKGPIFTPYQLYRSLNDDRFSYWRRRQLKKG